MKRHKLSIWLLASLVAVAAGAVAVITVAAVGIDSWRVLHTLYPTPETESAFLKTYKPEPVVDGFAENLPRGYSDGISTGPGREYLEYQGGFEFYIAMRLDKSVALMQALRAHAEQQLAANRAEILSDSGDAWKGFRIDYKVDKSVGSLTIWPIVASHQYIRHRLPLPVGVEDVTVRIEERERWLPNGAATVALAKPVY